MLLRTILLLSALLLATISRAPQAFAQPITGCPWCTSPTTCKIIDENTPIGGCYVIERCREIQGNCEIEDPSHLAALLAPHFSSAGIRFSGFEAVTLAGRDRNLAVLGEGMLIEWNCSGGVRGVYERRADGGFIVHDPAEFKRFGIHNILVSAHKT